MIGRGTRLCPDLFGPGEDKKFFYIFDYCQNLEYFSQNPETTDGSAAESLGTRLFKGRLELIQELDKKMRPEGDPAVAEGDKGYGDVTEGAVRQNTAELLRSAVAAMNPDNFVVRPKRRLVEKYKQADAWVALSGDSLSELAHEVAGLPSELEAESEEAKRFDLLILNVQLTVLRGTPGFERLRDQIRAIAGLLEEKANIPLVKEQLPLIQDLQSDEWWEDVTVPMLEMARKCIRDLVQLIEKQQRKPIYTDFEDQLGLETAVAFPDLNIGSDFERFRAKARQFLREHQNHLTIHKLRWNQPLTPTDLDELERMLTKAGIGSEAEVARAKQESSGLGLFIRSLVGLDRQAAKRAFGDFLSDKTVKANQIEFINLIIDYLTEHGVMDPGLLYESPFTDISPRGPEGVFTGAQVNHLIAVLAEVRKRAAS
ncbi:MAG TPA: type I restriction-modification enzyme R subunit C-terminal domain-containing protein [Symbiobacteriaceae bacterium]|jgi:type I restriction enzyme R subunit